VLGLAGVPLRGVVVNGVPASRQPTYYGRSRKQRRLARRRAWQPRWSGRSQAPAPVGYEPPVQQPDAAPATRVDRARS
jgi:hypothetical protein